MRPMSRLSALAAVLLTLGAACSGSSASPASTTASSSPAAADLSAVKVFETGEYKHLPIGTPISYPMSPPVWGDHANPPGWQNCGSYADPVPNEFAVHTLEHGAVWITYSPDLADAEVAKLRAFTEGRSHILVSPFPGLDAPVVATAWGFQLALDGADDPRLPAFIERYYQSAASPEPGAICTGGQGTPL